MNQTRIVLDQSEIPTHWYNIVADLKTPPLPPLGGDGNPVTPDKMLAIFPAPGRGQEIQGRSRFSARARPASRGPTVPRRALMDWGWPVSTAA